MSTTPRQSFSWLGWTIMAILLLLCPILQYHVYLSHDISWHLIETQRFLAGGTYSQNFMDIDPTIIIYTLIIPVLIAKYLVMNIVWVTRCYVFLLCLISLCCCLTVLKKLFFNNRLMLNVVAITISFILLILPIYEFGQRDHLMLVFIFPYLCMICALVSGFVFSRKLSMMISLLAGIGFIVNIKLWPLFLITEIYLTAHRGWKTFFRWETFIILGVTILYLVSIFIFTPDYVSFVLPLVMSLYVGGYNITWEEIFLSSASMSFIASFIGYFLFLLQTKKSKPLLTLCLIANTTFWVVYILTRKVWYYHQYTVLAFSLLMLVLMITEIISQYRFNAPHFVSIAMIVFLGFMLLIGPLKGYLNLQSEAYLTYNPHQSTLLSKLIQTTQQLAEHQSIFVFSVSMRQGTLMTYAHVDYASRFNTLWMLPGLLDQARKKAVSEQRARQLQANLLAQDLYHYRPEVIIVDNTNDFEYLDSDYFRS